MDQAHHMTRGILPLSHYGSASRGEGPAWEGGREPSLLQFLLYLNIGWSYDLPVR